MDEKKLVDYLIVLKFSWSSSCLFKVPGLHAMLDDAARGTAGT